MKPLGGWARSILVLAALVAAAQAGAVQSSNTTAPGAPKKGTGQAQAQGNWPRKIKLGEATLSVDAPQAQSLEGNKLKAQSAVGLDAGQGGEPAYGTAWLEADVDIHRDSRQLTLVSVTVPRVQIPGIGASRLQQIGTRLGQVLTHQQWTLPLDDVLASVKSAGLRSDTPPKLNMQPPRILFESQPAILLVFDGEPRFKPVEGSKLERAQNTPFLVLHDPKGSAYYLNGGTLWFHAPDPKGPWVKADSVPPEAAQIAARDLKDGGVSDTEVKQAKDTADRRVPKILVATESTELIVSDGPPQWTPIVGGELDTLGNSEGDVFRTTADQQVWVVLSGRWYKSASLSGPWTYVQADALPATFRRIPASSNKADVLAFVPGTGPSRDAVADATKPRTAAIKRSDAHVSVTYDGEPKFEAVPGTHVEYALNTPDSVLRIRGRYYVCDEGVWFTGPSPAGPWVVADSIPEDEIQTIPPESPVYNTRYAYVYDATPELVYTAYTPAYLGSYPYYGSVVYGTGWFYRPWWGAFYYPRPWTWGFHARYAPFVGWGYGFAWGPAWAGFRYGFGWGWGARWCGPGGFYRPAFRNVNVTRNVTVNRNVTRNIYNSGANKSRNASTQVASKGNATKSGGTGSKSGANASKQSASKGSTAHNNQSGKGGSGGQGKSAKESSHAKSPSGGHSGSGHTGGGHASGGHSGGGKKH